MKKRVWKSWAVMIKSEALPSKPNFELYSKKLCKIVAKEEEHSEIIKVRIEEV